MLNILGMVFENWPMKARHTRRIIAAVMKYVRKTAIYSGSDYKRNYTDCKGINVTPLLDKTL
jgi:hypothetical protein